MRFPIIIVGLCVLFEVSATSSEKDTTSFWDMIPVVSQGKSLVQLIFGDAEGAKKTQEKFLNEGLVTSQLRSVYFLATGEPKTAGNIQGKFFSNLEGVVDSLPVIGHVKGGIHLLAGDDKHGWSALKSSTSTTGAIVGGVFGGPLGAIGGHLLTDAVITGTDAVLNGNKSQPHGLIDYAVNFKNLKPGEHFDVIAGLALDAKAGKAGKKVKSKSDLFNIGRSQHKESAGYHELTPFIKNEKLKKNRIVGMLRDEEIPENSDSDLKELSPMAIDENHYDISNTLKYQTFNYFLKNDVTYKNFINFKIPEIFRNTFDDIDKYKQDYYLDKLDLDAIKNKFTYLTDSEKSLIKKHDFRSVDTAAHTYDGFMCSLAGILETDIETIKNYISGKVSDSPNSGINPTTYLQALADKNLIKFAESDKLDNIEDLMMYLKYFKNKFEGKHIIINKMVDDESGKSSVLKYKFLDNNPIPAMLLVDYKYPGFLKPGIPNPYRFKSSIDTNLFTHFYLNIIQKL